MFSAIKTAFPAGAFAATAGPEVTKAVLGYIALTDAAPLIIAKKGTIREIWNARRRLC